MRIGYSYWGFLGDYKYEHGQEVSTPDGNAAYSWAIIWEAIRRGHLVLPMQKNRDVEGWKIHGDDLFASFSREKRARAFSHLELSNYAFKSSTGHPELDVLLVEWRFPIPGRNTLDMRGKPGYQEDLERQLSILNHYSDLGVPIIIWDLDHKLTYLDERRWSPAAVFETSLQPKRQHIVRTTVDFPIVVDDLLQHPTLEADPNRKLVYVGNRYERDDVIEQLIAPVAKKFPQQVEFWGKWLEADQLWPDIKYHGRIAMRDFHKAYGTAVACPILAKKSYFETGFMTPRPWEALLFGTLPIGFEEHIGIRKYVLEEQLLWSGHDLGEMLDEKLGGMASLTWGERDQLRQELAHQLSFCDAKNFVDKIEQVLV